MHYAWIVVFTWVLGAGCAPSPRLGSPDPKEGAEDGAADAAADGAYPADGGSPLSGCLGGETMRCGIDRGSCRSGVRQCVDGELGPCVGAIDPGLEVCNELDDD